jgi:hypothetical protein
VVDILVWIPKLLCPTAAKNVGGDIGERLLWRQKAADHIHSLTGRPDMELVYTAEEHKS